MTGGLLLAGSLVAIALTGWAVVSCLPGLGPISATLGIALVGYAELVLVPVVLSPFGALGRPGLLVGFAVCLAAATALWVVRRRPHGSIVPGIRVARSAFADPTLACLGALLLLAGAYVLVLALATPELDWDPNAYHLPRAVFWLQQGGIGEIRGAADVRLSWAPPGAEIATAVTMAVAETDRFIGLPQLLAWPVCALAVVGLSRRLGWDPRASLFAGLVFACLPVVLLQAPSGFNDLVVAAALLAAFHLVLGRSDAETALAAGGLALALATKLTAVIALPVFLLLALLARPALWRRSVAACAAGTLAGGAWYVLTLVRTGSLDGGWADTFDQTPDRAPVEVLVRAQRYVLDFFDLSGFPGADVAWLPIAAGVVLVVGVALHVARGGARPGWPTLLAAAALLTSLPWLVEATRWGAVRAFAHTLRLVGAGDRLGELAVDPPVVASPFSSWYGPVFVLLWCVALGTTALAFVRRTSRARPRAWPFLLAPLVFAGVFAVATIDDGARGRFFVFPVGLCAAALAITFELRVVRLALPAAVAATMLVGFVHSEPRPLGIELFAPVRTPEVWGLDRFEGLDAMSAMFGDPTRWTALPSTATGPALAVAAEGEYPLYALLGRENGRRLVLVDDPSRVPPGLDLLLVTPHARKPGCGEPWRPLPATGQDWYTLYARAAAAPCANA